MDYGKLAYVKAEELERSMRSRGDKRTSVTAAFFPRAALESGYAPCSVYGTGNVALTVSLLISAPHGARDVKVILYCGDAIVACTRLSADEGGRQSVTLLASVYPVNGEKLKVVAEESGLLLEEMRALAQGNDAFLTSGQEGYKADCLGGEIFLAREKDGYVYLSKYGGESEKNVFHGSTFDIAAAKSGIEMACCDDDGNMWGICYDSELNETARIRLGRAMDSVALGNYSYGRLLAATKGGKLYFAYAEEGFVGLSDWQEADFGAGADEVYLSRQSENSALIIKRGKALYAKLPLPARGMRDCVSVLLSIETLGD